jgi:ABC-type lipoprotein export system ATPase subunit
MLRVTDLAYRLPNHQAVLDGLSFELRPGECMAVFGGERTGKTLLLKILGGLADPTEGKVLYQDIDLHKVEGLALDKMRADIGFLFSGKGLISNLSIEENLMLPVRHYYPPAEFPKMRERLLDLLVELGLADTLALRPAQLSHTRGKLAALARMMLTDPHLLLLDNPFFNLDLSGRKHFLDFFRSLPRGDRATVMITDDLELTLEFADRALALGPDGAHTFYAKSGFDRLEAVFESGTWGFD